MIPADACNPPTLVRAALVDPERLVARSLECWFAQSDSNIRFVAIPRDWAELGGIDERGLDIVVVCLDCVHLPTIADHIGAVARLGIPTLALARQPVASLLRKVLPAGVSGFVSRTEEPETFINAIHAVASGGSFLPEHLAEHLMHDPTPRLSFQERRVMRSYAAGSTARQVSSELGITEETAKSYLKRIREKYRRMGIDVGSKLDLHRQAVIEGLLDEQHDPPSTTRPAPRPTTTFPKQPEQR